MAPNIIAPNINKILKNKPVHSQYGAPLGKSDRYNGEYDWEADKSQPTHEPLYVQKIRFVDGDYAPDGTYWGGGSSLYCAFNNDSEIYVRAESRSEAIECVLEEYPNAIFRGAKGARQNQSA